MDASDPSPFIQNAEHLGQDNRVTLPPCIPRRTYIDQQGTVQKDLYFYTRHLQKAIYVQPQSHADKGMLPHLRSHRLDRWIRSLNCFIKPYKPRVDQRMEELTHPFMIETRKGRSLAVGNSIRMKNLLCSYYLLKIHSMYQPQLHAYNGIQKTRQDKCRIGFYYVGIKINALIKRLAY